MGLKSTRLRKNKPLYSSFRKGRKNTEYAGSMKLKSDKFVKLSSFPGMRFGKKSRVLTVLAFVFIIFILGLYYIYPQKISAEYGKEFTISVGQGAVLENIQVRLEKMIFPSCEFGLECRSIGAAISMSSEGKRFDTDLMNGKEKEFFIIDKEIRVKLVKAEYGSASFVVFAG